MYTNVLTDWQGQDMILDDGDVIAGVHTNVGHLAIPVGAVVTVHPYDIETESFGRVTIFAVSAAIEGSLTANSAGYPGENGPGAGTDRSGAGYGGRGGAGIVGAAGHVYGSAESPEHLGSGGGFSRGDAAGAGGGAIRLVTSGTLNVEGVVSSNGGSADDRGGSGSGGSVWLQAASITGDGLISADGGSSAWQNGGGGGGRIALDTPDHRFEGTVRAQGRAGSYDIPGHGTLNFISDPDSDLVIAADIALPPNTNWVFRSLTVMEGVVFEVQSSTDTVSRLRFLGDVTIASNGTLSADSQGYPGEKGPGAGTARCGAGYGGHGGVGIAGFNGGRYGCAFAPVHLGSGGGNTRGHPGAGGGALILDVTGILTIDGTLSANGGRANDRSGGGSGGSIWLKAGAITGNGSITADGGYADTGQNAGGGGGRIALETLQNDFAGIIRARGLAGNRNDAGHGTLNFMSDPDSDLVIAADIALPPNTNWVFGSLTVMENVVFEVQSSTDTVSRLRFLNDVTIASNGTLSANSQGYLNDAGDGFGTGRSGAGYGGKGGQGSTGIPGDIYGAPDKPDRLGSSGGDQNSSQPGVGGGALILQVDGVLTVDGTVSANSGRQANHRGGGGSGGSVWLRAYRIAGTGEISANGGAGALNNNNTGGGGGGRILLDHGWIDGFERRAGQVMTSLEPPESLDFVGDVTAAGGSGDAENGEDGTIRFRYLPIPFPGTLILVR